VFFISDIAVVAVVSSLFVLTILGFVAFFVTVFRIRQKVALYKPLYDYGTCR
jgi:hypothetical protein